MNEERDTLDMIAWAFQLGQCSRDLYEIMKYMEEIENDCFIINDSSKFSRAYHDLQHIVKLMEP